MATIESNMKLKYTLGDGLNPLVTDASTWGAVSHEDYDVVKDIIESCGNAGVTKGYFRFKEESVTIPAGTEGKVLESQTLICERQDAGAVYIKGLFPVENADLSALKANLVGKPVGGANITDVVIKASTKSIL